MTLSDLKPESETQVPEPTPSPNPAARVDRRSAGTPPPQRSWTEGPVLVMVLLAFQIFCAVIFLFDVTTDFYDAGWSLFSDLNLLPEFLAVLGLAAAIGFMAMVLRRMLGRQKQLEKGMSVASGALAEMIEGYFAAWNLTPSEQAVATYTIKGFSIAEIAGLRKSAEGTIKTHLNAIYRKAGVSGRAQLVSLLVEDLLAESLVPQQAGEAA